MNLFYVDGGCLNNGRGNSEAYGSFWFDNKVYHFNFGYGGTNNEAEYKALIKALEFAIERKVVSPTFCTDSELMYFQLRGIYRVKAKNLKSLYQKARDYLTQVNGKMNRIDRSIIVARLGH